MEKYISEGFASSSARYFMKLVRFRKRCSYCLRKLKRSEKKLKVCAHCMQN